jgi:hypothetical protein
MEGHYLAFYIFWRKFKRCLEQLMIWKLNPRHRSTGTENPDLFWASKWLKVELDAQIAPLGFEKSGENVWVNSATVPYRKIIQLTSIKGASNSLLWGYSFDFCPVVDSSCTKLRWARTPKSACAMLLYDPIDYWNENEQNWRISPFSSKEENMKNLQRLLNAAREYFHKIVNLKDIIQEFESWEVRPTLRFGYSSYQHAPLAHIFCLTLNGEISAANKRFKIWCDANKPEPELLKKLDELLVVSNLVR